MDTRSLNYKNPNDREHVELSPFILYSRTNTYVVAMQTQIIWRSEKLYVLKFSPSEHQSRNRLSLCDARASQHIAHTSVLSCHITYALEKPQGKQETA